MRRRLMRMWYGDGAGSALLLPLSALYAGIMAARRRAYERGWLPAVDPGPRVVVVGNISVGGTGKTPLVAWLAQRLESAGHRVGIVSRGYGSASATPRLVEPGAAWEESGDEPLLLRRQTGLPVAVGRDRVAAAKLLELARVDTIVADDGLQHLRLARRCEIAVIDGERGLGNGYLLPAGPLREPASVLSSVDAIVFNGGSPEGLGRDLSSALPGAMPPSFRMRLEPGPAMPVAGGGSPRALAQFQGSRVHAVAGIGNPGRFFDMLRRHAVQAVEHAFPDHHAFQPGDLAFGDGLPVLMTEKDAVKCMRFAAANAWYVPVAASLDERAAAALLALVTAKLGNPNL